MNKIDGRKLTEIQLHEIRLKIDKLRGNGKTMREIAHAVGMSYAYVCKICKLVKEGGPDALKPKVRGPKKFINRKIDAEKRVSTKKFISNSTPEENTIEGQLWTTEAVKKFIKKKYKIDMPHRTVRDYLKRWKFYPYEKSVKEAKAKISESYAYKSGDINLNRKDIEVHWCSIREDLKRKGVISTKAGRDKVRFMVFTKPFNSEILRSFLDRLIADCDRKVLLIVPNSKSVVGLSRSAENSAWLNQQEKNNKLELLAF